MMSYAVLIFLGNTLSTFCLIGLIWTIQVVHYPSFEFVDSVKFTQFEKFHQRRISFIVVPTMLIELVTSVLLLWSRPELLPFWATLLGFALVGIVWISTFWFQVPLHTQLAKGISANAIRRLIRTNWTRTLAWTSRGVLISWTVARYMTDGRTG